MHCQVCGAESGKYPLCKACNQLREQGLVAKCGQCGRWHRTDAPCPAAPAGAPTGDAPASAAPDTPYLYALRNRLVSANEQGYYTAIQAALPPGYHVYPQINLAAVIERTDHARFCNELFRNVDFLITDGNFTPKIAVEINDRTHYRADRQERDKKVRRICKEAGLPLVTLWTSYGVQPDYIQKRLTKALETPPVRVHHFSEASNRPPLPPTAAPSMSPCAPPIANPVCQTASSTTPGHSSHPKTHTPIMLLLVLLSALLAVVLAIIYCIASV